MVSFHDPCTRRRTTEIVSGLSQKEFESKLFRPFLRAARELHFEESETERVAGSS